MDFKNKFGWILSGGMVVMVMLFVQPAWAVWSEPTIAPIKMTEPLANNPPPVTGQTFHVSPSGNNANPGTSVAQAWRTIGKAMQTLTAGQVALIHEGVYNEGNLSPTNSGAPGNYITFKAAPGETPEINCVGNTFCINGITQNFSYIVFDGLNFHHSSQQILVCGDTNGPGGNCHHLWLINGKYHDTGEKDGRGFAALVFVNGSFRNVISNNEIYNFGTQAVGLNNETHDSITEFNNIHNGGYHIDDHHIIGSAGRSYGNVIRYNKVHDTHRKSNSTNKCFQMTHVQKISCQGGTAIYVDVHQKDGGPPATYLYNNIVWNNNGGFNIFNSDNVYVFNNIAYHNGFGPSFFYFTDTYPFGVYNESDIIGSGPMEVPYQGMHGRGISTGGNADGDSDDGVGRSTNRVFMFNNVSFDNKNEGFIVGGQNVQVKNNISMNNAKEEFKSGQSDGPMVQSFMHNLYFDSAGGTLVSSSLLALSVSGLQANPQFVNAAAGNFYLLSGSPARDSGTSLTSFNFDFENKTRPQGSQWDRGAYEFGSGGGDSIFPTVSMTAPANGATISGTITVAANASDNAGVVGVQFKLDGANLGVEDTASPYSVSWNTTQTSNGSHTLTAVARDAAGNQATASTVTVTVSNTTIPSVHAVPGKIEAENYLVGGEGVGYHDTTSGNSGGQYRTDNVDIKVVTGEGPTVGWTAAGEWLAYSINAQSSGTYRVLLRVANGGSANASLHLEIDGVNVTGPIAVAPTGSWDTQTTLTTSFFSLTSGLHTLRVVFDVVPVDLNWMDFEKNTSPVLAAIGNKSIAEDSTLTFTVSATDADGDALIYSATGLPSGATFTPATRTFSWRPDFTQAGTYPGVHFDVSDGRGGTDSETITITVTNTNRSPVVNDVTNKAVNEGQLLSFSVTASDSDGDPITLTALPLPTGATFTSSGTSGTFSWTSTFSQAGSYTVTFTVSDGNLSHSDTITITVNNVNRSPTANAGADQTGNTGQALTFNGSASSDPDGDTITYSWNFGDGTPSASGVSVTHSYVTAGSYTVTLTVTDSGGLSSTDTLAATITNPPAPVPGIIEAENYNPGGEGVAYHDTSPGNNGDSSCSSTDVDVKTVTGEGCTVGWTAAGEWLAYSINAQSSGTYRVLLRVANGGSVNASLHLEIDGVNMTGPILVAPTGSWNTHTTVTTQSFALASGLHTLRVVFDIAPVDLNRMEFKVNLLSNPDFGSGTTGWSFPATGVITTTATELHSVPRAAKINAGTSWVAITQTVDATAGWNYSISAWMRTSSLSSSFGRINVEWLNSTNGVIRTDYVSAQISGTTAYTQYIENFTAPANTAKVRLLCIRGAGGSGTVQFDDLSVAK